MALPSRAFASRVRAGLERAVHFVVRAKTDEEGFALFGGHRPRRYVSRLYLGEREHRLSVALHRPTTAALCRTLLRQYGLVVFCGDTMPPDIAGDVLVTPRFVDLSLPLPNPLWGPDAHWCHSVREDLRKIRRQQYQYEVQVGDDWVTEFHRSFHVPTILQRHGAEGFTASDRDLRARARTPGTEFVRITRGGEWVAGCVNRSTPEGYRLHYLGWRGGDPQLLKDGIVAAIYWSSLCRASELQSPRIYLGQVAPFLEDRLLLFKGKWNAHLEPLSSNYGDLNLLIDPSHQTCRRFLRTHSLLARGENGDAIVYSSQRPDEVVISPTIRAGISRWYRWLERPHARASALRSEVPTPLCPWVVEEEILPAETPAGDRPFEGARTG
jgi:hypothetical protein